jgi:radical SAM protein with 4Fe4S-binding SPASM domain
MFDINFFQNTQKLKENIVSREYSEIDSKYLFESLEKLRNKKPYVFNLETTNNCNMKCIMCPRTTAMTRNITTIDDENFESVIQQIKPHTKEEIDKFLEFINEEYGINELSRSENAFYFYVSSTCITLHGYGEPLIDPNIVSRVQLATKYKIPTYFSCVPSNIDIDKISILMKSGLTVIKFSIDSLDDMEAKEIRGKKNNFTDAYVKILEILDLKKEFNYQTKIICTMLDLSTDTKSLEKQKRFIELWSDKDVFAYVKSLDNRWYNDLDENLQNKSHYESQYCEFPWTSLTIMSNGNVVPCTQDYDTEMVFGNIKNNSLEDIWNSDKYKEFRQWHIDGNFPKGNKCNERCDLKKIYFYTKGEKC